MNRSTVSGQSAGQKGGNWQLPTITTKSITLTTVFSRSKLFDEFKLVEEEDLSDEERLQLLEDQKTSEETFKLIKNQRFDNKDAILQQLITSQPAMEAAQAGTQLPDWDQYWDDREEEELEPAELDEDATPKITFLDSVRSCTTLDCLRKAHDIPRRKGQFNFPHALMVGWQKSATTSLYAHLTQHPMVIEPENKEPEFFTLDCKADPLYGCPLDKQKEYIEKTLDLPEYVESAGSVMSFEASTHYGMNGDILAPALRKAMPWVKIVISLREPISRAISMLVHLADVQHHGCLAEDNPNLYHCLITESQLTGHPGDFNFLDSPHGNYSHALKSWFHHFPANQVHLIQYEALVSEYNEKSLLKSFKKFLDLDPSLPKKGLGMHNTRKGRIQPKGWPMEKTEYLDLIDRVRPDAVEVAKVAEMYGFGSAEKWLQYWEAVWQSNLKSCDAKGHCKIRPS